MAEGDIDIMPMDEFTNEELRMLIDSHMSAIISLSDTYTLESILPKYDMAQEHIIRCLSRCFKITETAQSLLLKRMRKKRNEVSNNGDDNGTDDLQL